MIETDGKPVMSVLIVEDSESDAKLIERALSRAGYDVQARRVDTSQAMRAALCERFWDVILADYVIPGFGAPQALALLKEMGLDIPFICVSGSVGEESAVSLLKEGASDFVLKDSLARLVPAVEREIREAVVRSERKRAESELQRSQRQFLELVNSIEGIVWEADADTLRFTYISNQVERMLGYPVEQWLTNPGFWAAHVHPDDREWAVAFCSTCAAERESFEYEYRMISADRRTVWVRDIVRVVQEPNQTRKLRGLLVDVSRRKQVENALEARAEQQASIARLGLDALVSDDLDAVFQEAVEGIAATLDADFAIVMEPLPGREEFKLSASTGYTGLPEGEITVGADPHSLLSRTMTAQEPIVSRDVRTDHRLSAPAFMIEHGVVSSMTTVVPGRERGLAVVGVQTSRQREFSRSDREYLETVANLLAHAIERKRTGDALRDSETRYRLLVDEARDAIFGIATNGIILWANQAARDITGAGKGEWVGREFTPMVHPDDRSFAVQLFREIVSGVRQPPFRLRLAPELGENRALEFTMTPLEIDGEIVSIIGIARDLSERQRLEDQLRQAQKMEVVGQLAGGVAHDFRNVLQAIVGFTRMARDPATPHEERAELFDEILAAASRGADLSQQLLAFSRQQPLELRDTNLGRWLDEIARMIRRVIGDDIDLRVHRGERLGNVRADSAQIGQVLINLCVNARDAMPQGGVIEIDAANVELGRGGRPVPLSGRPGHFVRLRVRDTGKGMDAKTKEKIFEPFFSTKPTGKGTGLGLSVAYGIIQQHDGFIEIESEPGEGTTFFIYLPVVETRQQTSESGLEATGGDFTETILLAEDEPAVRRMVEQFLRRAGYHVLSAEDGVEATELFTRNRDKVRIAVLDAVMPHMSGLDAFARMRELEPQLPAIFCTGYSEDLAVRGHTVPEGSKLLRKPYDMDDLLRLIKEELARLEVR